MVTEWGMSEEIGPLNFARGGGEVFLGRDFSQADPHSEDTAKRIDAEIRRIVTTQYDRAKALLAEHKAGLERVARALLDYETLNGDEIETLFKGGAIERRVPPPRPVAARPTAEPKKKRRPSLVPPVLGGGEPEPDPA
jgi:cell division protease FtsH